MRCVLKHSSSYDNANWDNVKAFLALYRAKDYEAAAESLGVDGSTLRRKIQSLEVVLGYSLFVKENNRWTLTPGTEIILDAALNMEMSTRLFFGMTPRDKGGVVKISLPFALINQFSDVLIQFRNVYPEFTFNISSDARFVDLEREGFDFAIRLARPVSNMNSLKIKMLGTFGLGVFGSKSYLNEMIKKYGKESILGKSELIETGINFSHKSHEFIFSSLNWEQLGFLGEVKIVCDDLESCASFCMKGAGLAILPKFLAHRYSELSCVYDASNTLMAELWLVSRLDMRSEWQVVLGDMLSLKSKELEIY